MSGALGLASDLTGNDPREAIVTNLDGGLAPGNDIVRITWPDTTTVVAKTISDPAQHGEVEAACLQALAGVSGTPTYLGHHVHPDGAVTILMNAIAKVERAWTTSDHQQAHQILAEVTSALNGIVAVPHMRERHELATFVHRGTPLISDLLADGHAIARRAHEGLTRLNSPRDAAAQHTDTWSANWLLDANGPTLIDFGSACLATVGYDHALHELLTEGDPQARAHRAQAAGADLRTQLDLASVHSVQLHAGLHSRHAGWRDWCHKHHDRVIAMTRHLMA